MPNESDFSMLFSEIPYVGHDRGDCVSLPNRISSFDVFDAQSKQDNPSPWEENGFGD